MSYKKYFYINEDVELETSLHDYNPSITLFDLVILTNVRLPRDGSTIYKHCSKHMYLSCLPIDKQIYEWEDITDKYDWEKTISTGKLVKIH